MFYGFRSLDRVLRGEATHPARMAQGEVDVAVARLSTVLVVLAAFYGACMGSFALVSRWGTPRMTDGLMQMASSAVKVPSLLLLTIFVTGPSLYVFNALVGSQLTMRSMVRLLTAAAGVLIALLAAFGPILVFFSLFTESYAFIVLLNVALFAIPGMLGLRFLLQTLRRLALVPVSRPGLPPEPSPDPQAVEPPPVPGPLDRVVSDFEQLRSVRRVFSIWVVVFGLVGAQMSWVMRPFILSPTSQFALFRKRDSNFFQAVVQKVNDLFDESAPRQKRGW